MLLRKSLTRLYHRISELSEKYGWIVFAAVAVSTITWHIIFLITIFFTGKAVIVEPNKIVCVLEILLYVIALFNGIKLIKKMINHGA